ncbi:MAG: hypothetical protein L6R41_000930 [Letrouitia leprolyta]|nr:MAG: hypothetical protein L6R41_000930 [Letrouitia leprolyta]
MPACSDMSIRDWYFQTEEILGDPIEAATRAIGVYLAGVQAVGRDQISPTPKAAAAPPAKEKKTAGRKAGAAKQADALKEALGEEEPSKKGRRRPKGSGAGAKKETKVPAKAVNGTVRSKTRSTKK